MHKEYRIIFIKNEPRSNLTKYVIVIQDPQIPDPEKTYSGSGSRINGAKKPRI
jgi:hypothetical protein